MPDSSVKTRALNAGGAESGAVSARGGQFDGGLTRVIDAWFGLPVDVRAAVIKLVDDARQAPS